jgi:hypothetical protein
MLIRLVSLSALSLSLLTLLQAEGVKLTGANGRSVEFAGIWEARPEGLIVVTSCFCAARSRSTSGSSPRF